MATRAAVLRLQLQEGITGPAGRSEKALRSLDKALAAMGKNGGPEVKRLVKQLEYLRKKSTAIEEFTGARKGFKDLWTEMRVARGHLRNLERDFASVAKPTQKMRSELNTARLAVRNTTDAFRQQGAEVRRTEGALRSFGVNSRQIAGSQRTIRDEMAKTIREMRKFQNQKPDPKPRPPRQQRPPGYGSVAGDVLATVGGGAVASRARGAAEQAFFYGIDFSQVTEFQDAIGGFSDSDRAKLNRQAEKIGGDTRFSNADVVRAQTAILQGGIRDPKTIMDLTEKVTDYALAMGVTLEEGAETVRGSAMSKRINLADAEAIGKFVDNLVWMAKQGGMNDEDVRQYHKYGGAATTGIGLPDSYAAAIGVILRRSGVRGDEAGVFARSSASKLVAPTNKGRSALNAMGVDYSDFTTMPDAWNERGIGLMLKNQFGKKMTPEMQEAVMDFLNNEEITDSVTGETRSAASDSGEFVTRLGEILGPLFANAQGKTSAMDARVLANKLSEYHKMSVESVDVVGLFEAIMSSDQTTLSLLNAYFTDRQGSRANMISQRWEEFKEQERKMANTPAGEANRIATEANDGIYGDWTRLTGTFETALTRTSQDFEGATRPVINALNSTLDGFINMDQGARQVTAGLVGLAATLAGFAALGAGGRLLGRIFGAGGGAATTAATTAVTGGGLFSTALLAGAPIGSMNLAQSDWLKTDAEKERWNRFENAIPGYFEGKKQQNANNVQARRSAASKAGQLSSAQGDLAKTTMSWPWAAQDGMRAYQSALMSGGDQAEAEAARIGEQIKQSLTVTGQPNVDTSQLERALGLARQVASILSNGKVSATAPAPAQPLKFGGPRAAGGPVSPGSTYLTGEEGPELFTPRRSGTIIPNRGGGGVNITNHFTIGAGGSAQQAREIAAILDRHLSRRIDMPFGSLNRFEE